MERWRVRQTEADYLDEIPEAVRSLIEARTGDGVFVVAPDYTIVLGPAGGAPYRMSRGGRDRQPLL